MAGFGAKPLRRSTAFKQFLLRVHPDRFHTLPKVHDENLQSIQLLNQFMDEQRSFRSDWNSGRKRVFFSAYVPTTKASYGGEELELKRFRLDLTTNVEDNMVRILRECGVEITPIANEQESSAASSSRTTSSTRENDPWDYGHDRSSSVGGMDFGFNEHFAQYQHFRRRKRSIMTLAEFFAYMQEPETQLKQKQLLHAWQSIESVKHTLVREFGLHEVSTSCGWASLPLNATLMSLLKTLRKLHSTNRAGFLRGVRVDMSADPSDIDYFNEYTVVLNVADVPLQWVEVLEKVDSEMLQYIHGARRDLELMQRNAEQALGGSVALVRGRTCSALAYRGFLQDIAATADAYMDDPHRLDTHGGHHAVMETATVVVEDSARQCVILDDGRVQAPSCTAASVVLEFVDANRSQIREREAEFANQRRQFEMLSDQCVAAFGLRSLTYGEGLRLEYVNRACSKLLLFASHGSTSLKTGGDTTALIMQAAQGQALRVDRLFGLAQDGVYTLPVEWLQ